MWLYMIAIALLILGVAGGALFGGVYTIVLLPLALIALVSGIFYAMSGRAAQRRAGGETDATHHEPAPLPHAREHDSGRAPTTPEGLADARRVSQ